MCEPGEFAKGSYFTVKFLNGSDGLQTQVHRAEPWRTKTL